MRNLLQTNSLLTQHHNNEPVVINFPSPKDIEKYDYGREVQAYRIPEISQTATRLSSNFDFVTFTYQRKTYNCKNKKKRHSIIYLYFNGKHVIALDIDIKTKFIVKNFFISRMSEIKINGVDVNYKQFCLHFGLKYKTLWYLIKHMKTASVVKLVLDNISIRLHQ